MMMKSQHCSPHLSFSETVDGNEVTTQGDAYFGTQSVLGTNEDAAADLIIEVDNVHKTYLLGVEGVPALRGVTMSIKRGEFVCVYGTSGGGKSTLLNVLGTIDKPTRGHLTLCGVKIGNQTPDAVLSDLRLNKLGFVFQTFNLLSALTALENVEMPMILAGNLSAAARRQRAKELLTAVGMEKRFNHVPAQLSGGEQQRVTIARSIANSPDILLLDEPTGDLDSVSTLRVMSLLTRLNREQHITLVMVTHDIGLKYFSDRVLWMRDGKLQRVEIVSETKRNETHAKLQQDIAALNEPNSGSAKGPGKRDKVNPWAQTVMRRPAHYEAVRGMEAMEDDLHRMTQSFARKKQIVATRDHVDQDEDEDVLIWPKEKDSEENFI
jgi:putative ABC transport system ATP-binding protein